MCETGFSNPRLFAMVENWRTQVKNSRAEFALEANHFGERISRRTSKAGGGWHKPRRIPYATKVAIVDRDDGTLCILAWASEGNTITIWCATMNDIEATLHRDKDGDDFVALMTLIRERSALGSRNTQKEIR